MYYFEGNYRSTPQQNLAGASRLQGKTELISRAQCERKKREERRIKENSAVVIQALVRGFITRRKYKTIYKLEFDAKVGTSTNITLDDIIFLLRRILLFDLNQSDSTRLSAATNIVLEKKEQILKQVLNNENWMWRMKMLMSYNMNFIENNFLEKSSIHFIECFTNFETLQSNINSEEAKKFIRSIFIYAVSNNYFNVCLNILLSTFDENLGHPLEKDVSCLIIRPFILMDIINDEIYEIKILDKFCEMINNWEKDDKHFSVFKFLMLELKTTKFPYIGFLNAILRMQVTNHNSVLLLCALYFDNNENLENMADIKVYYKVISNLSRTMPNSIINKQETNDECETDEDEPHTEMKILKECAVILNNKLKAEIWISHLKDIIDCEEWEILIDFSSCLHNMLLSENLPLYRNRIFMRLSQNKYLLKSFWKSVVQLKRISTFTDSVPIINYLAKGIFLEKDESSQMIPLLTMFVYFLKFCYSAMTEEEFYSDTCRSDDNAKPFSLTEMINLSRSLKDIMIGIILLAFPDTHGTGTDQFIQFHAPTSNVSYNAKCWTKLLYEIVGLVSLLQSRDARKRFTQEGHWLSNSIRISENIQIYDSAKYIPVKPFTYNRSNKSYKQMAEECIVLPTNESRNCFILNCVPFTVPFLKRFTILQTHFEVDKLEYQNPHLHFMQMPQHLLRIRRDYIYEDAFEKLSEQNALDLKSAVKIQMVNQYGLDEAGVDGGGIFREFITELLKTSFDPNRGFFIYNNDNELYPNPSVHVICQRFQSHYSFIGRILGKAIYEGIMSEIPLTDFFLAKLTGDCKNLHLTNLASLDPELYKNIINLQKFTGDFSELGLDFTIYTNEYGRSVCNELKPNGSNIPVTAENIAEYIDLVATYKMHETIAPQTQAFIEGLRSVFSLDLLKMFTPRELQIIISGDEAPINIDDMQRNTIYTGGFSADHPSIIMFWRILNSFSQKERSQLLKFVTSYSRPPLLGFKELHPPICIQCVEGVNERFPTSSTCMHLLKLPAFSDEKIMRSKLLYAIQSGFGFELS